MKIETLINLAGEISCELASVKDTIEPNEYEPWFAKNLEAAYELLCDVKDLIEE